MRALILAGGLGTRLREMVTDRPKVMAKVKGKPFLEYLIIFLKREGILEIVISVGYLAEKIINYFGNGKKFGVKIFYSCEKQELLGTGGAIKTAEKFFNNEFLVLNGDTYMNFKIADFVKFHQSKKADFSIALGKTYGYTAVGSILIDKNLRIIDFLEKKKVKKAYINSGFMIIEPKIFSFIPKKKAVSMEKEIIPLLINKGFRIYGYPVLKRFVDIGTPKGYQSAKRFLKKL